MWTNFQNSFTSWFVRKFSMYTSLRFPPNLQYIATLPCESQQEVKVANVAATCSFYSNWFCAIKPSITLRRNDVIYDTNFIQQHARSWMDQKWSKVGGLDIMDGPQGQKSGRAAVRPVRFRRLCPPSALPLREHTKIFGVYLSCHLAIAFVTRIFRQVSLALFLFAAVLSLTYW